MNKSDEYEFVCELSNGRTIPVQGTDVQMKQLRSMLKRGSLVSAESTIEVSSEVSQDGIAHLPPGKVMAKKKKSSSNGGRNLASSEELKPFLAVRVTDSSGKVHPDSADIMSDKIFGTNGDVVNAKSQLAACSFGKFLITHDYTEDISQHLSAPGVIDVKIDTTLLGNDRHTIVNSAISAVEDKMGLGRGGLPGPFQYVMFIIERCYTNCGWGAFAHINSWLSGYQGDYYKFVGVQMHEIGHNLNLVSFTE